MDTIHPTDTAPRCEILLAGSSAFDSSPSSVDDDATDLGSPPLFEISFQPESNAVDSGGTCCA